MSVRELIAGAQGKTQAQAQAQPQGRTLTSTVVGPPGREAMPGQEKGTGPAHGPGARARAEEDQGRARPVALAVVHLDLGSGRDPEGVGLGGALAQVPVGGPSALARMVVALGQVAWVREVGVVLTGDPGADPEGLLAAEADRLKVRWVRGSGEDALARLADGLRGLSAEEEQIVVLVHGVSPLLSPEVVGAAVEGLLLGRRDVVDTDLGSGVLPTGLDLAALGARVLYALDAALPPGDERRADPAALLRRSPLRHRVHELSPAELGPSLERSGRYYASFHLGLRTEEDVARLQLMAGILDRQREPRALSTLLRLLDQHPEWRSARDAVLAR